MVQMPDWRTKKTLLPSLVTHVIVVVSSGIDTTVMGSGGFTTPGPTCTRTSRVYARAWLCALSHSRAVGWRRSPRHRP